MQNSQMVTTNNTSEDVLLTDLVDISYGKDVSVKELNDKYPYPVFGANGVIGKYNKYTYDEPQIMVSCRGANSGQINISPPKCFITHNSLVLTPKNNSRLFRKYLFYALSSINKSDIVTGTAQPQVTIANLGKTTIPLLPYKQQVIFANKIDRLLELQESSSIRIDKAKLLIHKFRQSVLSSAVNGKLTERWREKNKDIKSAKLLIEEIEGKYNTKSKKWLIKPIDHSALPEIPEKWEWVRFIQVGELARGKSKHRPRNDPKLFGGKYPFIQTGDVARSSGKVSSYSQTYSEVGFAQSRLFPKGTLCITIAANIGDSGILQFDACFPDSVVGFIPYAPITSADYFQYYITTAKNNLEQYAPETAQKNINLAILNDLTIPLPPFDEINEIVNKVNELFAIADKIEQQIENAGNRVSKLSQSILSKAFKGELLN